MESFGWCHFENLRRQGERFSHFSWYLLYHGSGNKEPEHRPGNAPESIHGATIYIGDEMEALLDYQLPIFNRYYQDPEPGVYDPPAEHVPDERLNVSTTELWHGNMYMVSFQKPEA